MDKSGKTEAENEREALLLNQSMFLTEEQEYVMIPAPGSGVPGAPVDNEPPEGMEQHTPVLFLDLNSDDLSTGNFLKRSIFDFLSASIASRFYRFIFSSFTICQLFQFCPNF